MTALELRAPVSGWATPLEQVPDAAFAQKMVGDGIAIDPTSSELRAPCDGVVLSLHEAHHACILRCHDGAEVLLHIGIDTVNLRGEGFSPVTRAGKIVKAGDPLIVFDMDVLAKKARGLFTLMVVMNGDAYAIANRVQDREVTVGEPLLGLVGVAAAARRITEGAPRVVSQGPPQSDAEERAQRSAVLRAANGLHARPAAMIADRARKHPAAVRVTNKDRSANAKSIVSLMTLAARAGDTLTITAHGHRAAATADELAELIAGGLADDREHLAEVQATVHAKPAPHPAAPPFEANKEVLLRGTAAVPGLALGYAFSPARPRYAIPRDGAGVLKERQRLAAAIARVRGDLERAREGAPLAGAEAAILNVHLSLLDDPEIVEAADHAIDRGRSAAWAWKASMERYAAVLSGLSDPLLAERAADLRDVEERVIALLVESSGATEPAELPAHSILVVDELRPSDLAPRAAGRFVAVCTARGGPTSHGAIMAASMGIPAVVALGEGALRVPLGAPLIVDGDRGTVRVFPGEGTRRATEGEMFTRVARREKNRAARHRDARTQDGVRIEVLANLAHAGDVADAIGNGAEGCGLLRTEFLFLGRNSAPSEDEQLAEYEHIARALGSRPLVIRTIDVGGDKALPYLPVPAEENPALGLRGIRFALRQPKLLRTQIRAILRIESAATVRILVPMISGLAEMRAVRAIVEAERRALGCDPRAALGAMIEVPIAAMTTDVLASDADFFSIGTNDLVQYGAAADRGNPHLSPYGDGLHPGILRLVAQAVAGARALQRPVSICGGIASDPRAVALFIGLGVRQLSAVSLVIPDLKAFISSIDVPQCVQVAGKALELSSGDDVRALLNRTWPVI